MKKTLIILTLVILGLLFSLPTFAQKDDDRDLKSPSSKTKTKTKTTPVAEKETEDVKETKTAATKSTKKAVAVLSFDDASLGNKDLPLGKYLIDSLNKELSNTKAYEVTEKQQIEAVMKELNLSFDEAMNPKNAAKVGKRVSANTAIFGTISEYTIVTDELNVLFGARVRHTATVSLIIRLVDINTGVILESVEGTETAKKESIITVVGGKNTTMTPDLRIKLFSEAATKAVKTAVKQLSPLIQNSNPSQVAAKKEQDEPEKPASSSKTTSSSKNTPQPKNAAVEERTISSNNAAKVSRIIKDIVYVSGLGDIKVGDILSVVRGTGAGKEIAVIEVTEVGERTVKAKIIQGTGIQPEDRVKVIE